MSGVSTGETCETLKQFQPLNTFVPWHRFHQYMESPQDQLEEYSLDSLEIRVNQSLELSIGNELTPCLFHGLWSKVQWSTRSWPEACIITLMSQSTVGNLDYHFDQDSSYRTDVLMTRAGPRNKKTIFSMSIHMWQSCQILSIVAAFFLSFSFFFLCTVICYDHKCWTTG